MLAVESRGLAPIVKARLRAQAFLRADASAVLNKKFPAELPQRAERRSFFRRQNGFRSPEAARVKFRFAEQNANI
jgi:hypothetical protein